MPKGDESDPVISVTDHDKEIMKLKEEIEENRVLITLQQQFFQVEANFCLICLFMMFLGPAQPLLVDR